MKIKAFQCDNGREFDNNAFTDFANKNGLVFRFSCPHTSPQNGKSERMIRRINEIILVLLQHGSLPPQYWVDALHTATHLHNILPTSTLNFQTPTSALYFKQPAYDHLRIFGCECYPNTSSTRPHKLAPRSLPCVFIGYPPNHRGYRCLDPVTGRVYISRHVTFNESSFPFSNLHTSLPNSYSFLDDSDEPVPPVVLSNPPAPQPIPPDPPITPTAPSPQSSQPNTSAPSPPPLPTPRPTHKMTTRSMHGIFKPRALTTTTSPSPIPQSLHQALQDPHWKSAMIDEFTALKDNHTWELVPRPRDTSIIRCMWLFRHKFNADGTLERYKARLVVNGKTQQVGVTAIKRSVRL